MDIEGHGTSGPALPYKERIKCQSSYQEMRELRRCVFQNSLDMLNAYTVLSFSVQSVIGLSVSSGSSMVWQSQMEEEQREKVVEVEP